MTVERHLTTTSTVLRTGRQMACAILAGGKATRYGGAAKGMLLLADGVTIIGRILAEVAASGVSDVVIVANDPDAYRACGRRIIKDARPGMGPLGGIEAALLHFAGTYENVLILPCDLPDITRGEIAALRDAHVAHGARVTVAQTPDSLWHPLCVVVHSAVGPAIAAALDTDIRSVYRVWREANPFVVRFSDARPFLNVNTPADMATWQREAMQTSDVNGTQEQSVWRRCG